MKKRAMLRTRSGQTHLLTKYSVNVDRAEKRNALRQVLHPQSVREICPNVQVADVESKCRTVNVLVGHNVPNLVVDADTVSRVDIVSLAQILHGQHENVEVVDSRGLHHPVDPTAQVPVCGVCVCACVCVCARARVVLFVKQKANSYSEKLEREAVPHVSLCHGHALDAQ